MRAFILLGWLLGGLSGWAQEKVVQNFSGKHSLTTSSFQVADKWEIRWDASGSTAISLLSLDGTVVAGVSGSAQGSVYQPRGGTFSLQIDGAGIWHVSVVEIGAAVAAHSPSDAAPGPNYVPPSVIAAPPAATNVVSAATPAPAAVPAALSPPPTSSSSTASGLTEAQASAVVVIKGDYGAGTGFLARTKDGPVVVTNLHVISANPHLRILTTTGAEIKALALKGASDRDLAMFSIQDDHYNFFELATDIPTTVQTGDEVITPGNSEGGEVVLNTKGDVLGTGPDKIEISNPFYHGNSGGPVFHLKSGKVIAVVTQFMRVEASDEFDRASAANARSAITSSVRYFALRLDTVPTWETYDPEHFLAQTTFLKNFEELNRCLDSYLNGAHYEKAGLTSTNPEEGEPSSKYFLRNEKIRSIAENFKDQTANVGTSERLDAVRELTMSLDGQVDIDVAAIQNMNNFYSFEQERAKKDYAYRQALKKELDMIGNKVSDLGH